MQALKLRITQRARQYIDELLHRHPPGALPALMFGRSETYSEDGELLSEMPLHFSLAVYPREQADEIDRNFATTGQTVLYQADDLILCIPQSTLVAELVEGATLDVEGNTVCIV
jgi:hypothetical protein